MVVAVIGVLVSIAAWGFLEGVFQLQQELYVHLPHAVGYQNGPPTWWPLPVLAVGALIVALAITRLPGNGGHIPAMGLSASGPSGPNVLPGIILAGAATLASGLVLGPEAPLIAIGGGLAALTISLARRDAPPQVLMLVTAAGSFSALSFIFASPMIAAVLLIEAIGLGGPKLRVVLVPGLIASGIGTLVSLGDRVVIRAELEGLRARSASAIAARSSASPLSSDGRSPWRSSWRSWRASCNGAVCSPIGSCLAGTWSCFCPRSD